MPCSAVPQICHCIPPPLKTVMPIFKNCFSMPIYMFSACRFSFEISRLWKLIFCCEIDLVISCGTYTTHFYFRQDLWHGGIKPSLTTILTKSGVQHHASQVLSCLVGSQLTSLDSNCACQRMFSYIMYNLRKFIIFQLQSWIQVSWHCANKLEQHFSTLRSQFALDRQHAQILM